MATKLSPTMFKERYGRACKIACQGSGIFPSVKLAQLALETGWGKSIKGNNLFGIKSDKNWKGTVISFTTQEVVNGTRITFNGTGSIYRNRDVAIAEGVNKYTLFRHYLNEEQSIRDHTSFLKSNPRYSQAMMASTPEIQAQLLEDAGYSTSKNYNETLESIILKYNFKTLDK